MANKNKFVPYRDSKLTRLLTNSFGGNCRTLMIGTIGPADVGFDESLKTLCLADLIRGVVNFPRINYFIEEVKSENENQMEESEGDKEIFNF